MPDAPQFDTISVLIPGYSIEDLPTDLNEEQAAGLLNAIAVAWHPALLRRSRSLPCFRHAETSELPLGPQIVIVPAVSEDWLGHDWHQQLSDNGAVVLSAGSQRADWLSAVDNAFSAAASEPDPGASDSDPAAADLVADFLALGVCHLQVVLLSRRLHHYVDPDQYLLESEVQAAAAALAAGNYDQVQEHLKAAFECLLNTREQFHPVECFLLDLCLPAADTTATELQQLLQPQRPLSLCCSAGELAALLSSGPAEAGSAVPAADSDSAQVEDPPPAPQAQPGLNQALTATLRTALQDGRLSLLTGHRYELRTSLGSLATAYDDLWRGQQDLQQAVGQLPLHWARRRFGLLHSLPAVLNLFGFESAFHVALDDGIYPDRERGQMLWEGPDGSQIAATSRIPFAIDTSSGFLRFADRYAESMQEDNVAVMMLARLPNLRTPWLDDLHRIARYAPVLGQFGTFDDFVVAGSSQAGSMRFTAGEYLSPVLIQSSVLKTEAPISSPAELHQLRLRLEAAAAIDTLNAVLKPGAYVVDERIQQLADQLLEEENRRSETVVADAATAPDSVLPDVLSQLQTLEEEAGRLLVRQFPGQERSCRGIAVVNPLPFARQYTLQWPQDLQLPAASSACEEAFQQDSSAILNLKLPPGGLVWLTEAADEKSRQVLQDSQSGRPLAESGVLRNRFFEVLVNETTGGIAEVHFHGKRGNRMSQQVTFRYESDRTVIVDSEEVTTSYALTRMVDSRVLDAGPWFGRIETTSEICDPETGDAFARCVQTLTVERSSPRLHIDVRFENISREPVGNPWMTYFGCRFAWDNEAAAITRSVLGQASGFRSERFESPDYVEIADSDHRLLIVPYGRPYHRRSGPRMLDSLLIVEGETARQFRYTVEFDQPFPLRAASELSQPALTVPTSGAAPHATDNSWLLGLIAKNVVLARIRAETIAVDPELQTGNQSHQPTDPADNSGDRQATVGQAGRVRLVLLLQETEGLSASCGLRCLRAIKSARLRRPDGRTVHDLAVRPEGVQVEFSAFQIREVELTF